MSAANTPHIFPFLWMHGEDEATIREYIRVIDDSSLKAFCVESRPHPDFCGAIWWRDMDVVLDEAEKRRMKVWILDDSHFPTGYANGALKDADTALFHQSLVCHKIEFEGGAEELVLPESLLTQAQPWQPSPNEAYTLDLEHMRRFTDDRMLGVVAVKKHGAGLEDIIILRTEKDGTSELRARLPEGRYQICVLHLTRNRGPHRDYINMMDKGSVSKLIQAVYEPHYARYADRFGSVIAGFFSDEPELGNGHLYEQGKRLFELDDQAWSRELEAALQIEMGVDHLKLLPLLFEDDFAYPAKAQSRYLYMNEVTKAVKADFSMQLHDWCHAHGVLYIGHMIEDNGQHTRTGSSLGHYFRGLWGQDMAGVDDIGGQVLPQGEWNGVYGMWKQYRNGEFYHFVLGKLASSFAAIDPKKQGRALCEIFGAYGWEEGVRLEKYLADHFMVRGVNHFVPHAFSMKPFPDPDCPPHFYAHGHNPQVRHFGALMAYMQRVCKRISGGRPHADVAVLYNAEAEWCGDHLPLEGIARALTEQQIAFDFLPCDVFAEPCDYPVTVFDGLRVNTQRYRALVVPYSQFLPQYALKGIRALPSRGVDVFYVTDGRGAEDADAFIVTEQQALCDAVKAKAIHELEICPPDPYMRVLHYIKDDKHSYFVVNEGTQPYDGALILRGDTASGYSLYDPWSDTHIGLDCKINERSASIPLHVLPLNSMFVLDIPCKHKPKRKAAESRVALSDGWTRTHCTAIAYPNGFEGAKAVSVPDGFEKEHPYFSGVIRYEKSVPQETLGATPFLHITDAYEGVELFVNGASQGIQIVPPYVYDLRGSLQAGLNWLSIEVATTLEREMLRAPDPMRAFLGLGEKTTDTPSGINGEIYLSDRGRFDGTD